MARTVAESEIYYDRVKTYFLHEDQADFVVGFLNADMSDWETIPTPSPDDMILIRWRLSDAGFEYAGFIHHDGRYCFYFNDRNIIKVEYLDTGELDYFGIHEVTDLNLKLVARDLRLLQGS
jgi:hypothetical protein